MIKNLTTCEILNVSGSKCDGLCCARLGILSLMMVGIASIGIYELAEKYESDDPKSVGGSDCDKHRAGAPVIGGVFLGASSLLFISSFCFGR